jgi:ERCC4-type nuclease
MATDQQSSLPLTIWASKPKGEPARKLAGMGIAIRPIEQEEGNVDRYVLSERLAVERRTGSAFARGIQDKTLFTSAIYMREHFEIPILIVEGSIHSSYSSFNPQAARGALTSMMLVYGINLLSTPDVDETVALLAMLARQEQVGVPEISLIPKRKATDLADMQRRVIEMLPGCGMTLARDLLQRFGSVRRIVDATEAELCSVRGIGAKRAAEIHRTLNAEYESVDTERNLEDAIEAAPELLFERPVTLLARQHYIYSESQEHSKTPSRGLGGSAGTERHIVDLVFADEAANKLILVELKRGELAYEHEEQLQRYMDRAKESPLLQACLQAGTRLRGVLATLTACSYRPRHKGIAVRIVDRERTIEVLGRLRAERQKAQTS